MTNYPNFENLDIYDVFLSEYTPNLRKILQTMPEKEEDFIKTIYEKRDGKFQDPDFLEEFLSHMLSAQSLAPFFSLMSPKVFEEYLAFFDEPKPPSSVQLRKLDPLVAMRLLLLYPDEPRICGFVPDEIQTAVRALSHEEIRVAATHNQKLYDFCATAVNLYGVISLADLVALQQKYCPEFEANEEVFQEIATDFAPDMLELSFYEGHVVPDFFEDPEELEALIAEQEGKPRYLPHTKEEFFKYRDDCYIRPSIEWKNIQKYLETVNPDPKKIENVMCALNYDFKISDGLVSAIGSLVELGYASEQGDEEIPKLLFSLNQHARKWANKGHSDFEILQLQPKTRPFQDHYIPPSKNGPCPCGSGKKYKRCCGA